MLLEGFGWVDFRKQRPDPLEQLIWGITGEGGDSHLGVKAREFGN